MSLNRPQRASIKIHADKLLHGNVLSIDPSSTSLGFAISHKGVVVDSGTRKFRGDIGFRLHLIFMEVFKLHQEADADLLLIERLRSTAGGNFKQHTPIQLLWSVGAILAAAPIDFIEISPQSWKVFARENGMIKSDENDALAILGRALHLSEEFR
jgi:hypothetical protein